MTLQDIIKEIWNSGKEYSQVFDFDECFLREKWDERILSLLRQRVKASLLSDKVLEAYMRKFGWQLVDKSKHIDLRLQFKEVAQAQIQAILRILE